MTSATPPVAGLDGDRHTGRIQGGPTSTVDGGVCSSASFPVPPTRPRPSMEAHGAVIIPAHDEGAVIARTLRALLPVAGAARIEVIVVCNACSDDTAAIARSFSGVRVVEIDRASKTAAMNAGDRAATEWPRLYLDADVEIAPEAILDTFEALSCTDDALAARPTYAYDTSGASAPVRAYYRARARVPAPASRLWGAGGYGTNETGHGRLPDFPEVVADDSWFDSRFDESEKRIIDTIPMRVRTPRDTADLIAVLARQRRGYLALGISSEAGARGRGLLRSTRAPRDLADIAWYVMLTLVSRRRSRSIMRGEKPAQWERDASSRENDKENSR